MTEGQRGPPNTVGVEVGEIPEELVRARGRQSHSAGSAVQCKPGNSGAGAVRCSTHLRTSPTSVWPAAAAGPKRAV